MTPLPYSKVLVVQKRTKLELDLEAFGDMDALRDLSRNRPDVLQRTVESHERQVQSRRILLEKVFPTATFAFREALDDNSLSEKFDLIVSHGGDNHFTYVAHKVDQIPILGCNSDPKTSVGALLPFDSSNLIEVTKGTIHFIEEKWNQISTIIDYPNGSSVETVPAICEISIRNNSPDLTSRYWIEHDLLVEEQKCSGLLVYTGAGSTGWVASCQPKKLSTFEKDLPQFEVYAREIRAKRNHGKWRLSEFRTNKEVRVISEMNGGIAIDSLTERHYPFPPYCKATFRLSPKQLKVIVPVNV